MRDSGDVGLLDGGRLTRVAEVGLVAGDDVSDVRHGQIEELGLAV